MSRDLTTAMSNGLQERVVRPVLFGRFDFASDSIVAWTGPGTFSPSGTGDAAFDGQTFQPLGPFVEMSDIQEDQGIGGPLQFVLAGHDLDEPALRQVVRDKRQWRGRRAWVWLGLLDEDEYTVIADPTRIKTGYMVQMRTKRNVERAAIECTVHEDFGQSRSAPFRWIDHTRLFPSDTWSTFVTKLANKPRGLETSDTQAPAQGNGGQGGGFQWGAGGGTGAPWDGGGGGTGSQWGIRW